MNRAGELDLLVGQVALRILGELLAEDEDAVERRSELVRDVGEEFRLVLRGEGQLCGLVLERQPRLLDLLVLPLDLDVLFDKLLGFLRERPVGLLQLLLASLELARQLLRLGQETLGLHRGLDAIEHDADTDRQLFEECQV